LVLCISGSTEPRAEFLVFAAVFLHSFSICENNGLRSRPLAGSRCRNAVARGLSARSKAQAFERWARIRR